MRFRVTLEGTLISDAGSIDDDARNALGAAMAELNGLGNAGNAAIDLNSATGKITITCVVEAEDLGKAGLPASDNIYLALHTGGIGTPNWPNPDEPCWKVEFVSSRADLVDAAAA